MFIYNVTRLNPLLNGTEISDHSSLTKGLGTEQERLIEFSGRVCYRSTGNMGHNRNFIAARMQEGHTDIIEHVYVTMMLPTTNPVAWALANRPVSWDDPTRFFMVNQALTKANQILVSGNLRAWYYLLNELFHLDPENLLVRHLASISPQIFGVTEPITYLGGLFAPEAPIYSISDEAEPAGFARQRVSLIGLSPRIQQDDNKYLNYSAATFLIEGVSRALTHQLVRHRLLSYSQESQRYVDFEKGQGLPVVPPHIAADPNDLNTFMMAYRTAKTAYTILRKGQRKEDARFVLPNATETRLVVSGPLIAWDHFFKLRKDSAAQWEIRAMAEKALKLLIGEKLDYFLKYGLQ